MLTVREIHKSYGLNTALGGVTFSLSRGEKIAIVGPNGCGKSTLLRIIAGLEEADKGEVELAKHLEIGYLPQQVTVSSDESVETYLRRVVGLTEIEEQMHRLEVKLEDPTAVAEYTALRERYQNLHGYAFTHRAEALLEGFGLEGNSLNRNVESLSGGQKMKVALSGVLLKGVDLLLLDEPTNNLDIPALEWLEYFVRNTPVGCVIVSHDRRFLDATISKVGEIDWFKRTMTVFPGTYSAFLDHKRKLILQQKEEYRRQQEEIARIEEQARRKKAAASRGAHWGGSDNDKMLRGFKRDRAAKSARTGKALERRIEQMEKLERPNEREEFVIPLEPIEGVAKHSIDAVKTVAGYPGGFSIGPFSLSIKYGDRAVVLGVNGSGKTTVLKTLTGALVPLSGSVKIGSSLILGNLTQDQEGVPLDVTPLEFFTRSGAASEQEVFHLLDRFGFEEHEARKKLSDFSVGGRVRLLLALFSARKTNVLVLDEPTNHLDIEGMDALEAVLQGYTGTIVLTSHDRYLLEAVRPTRVYEIADGTIHESSLERYNPSSIRARMERLMRRLRV